MLLVRGDCGHHGERKYDGLNGRDVPRKCFLHVSGGFEVESTLCGSKNDAERPVEVMMIPVSSHRLYYLL